MSLRARTGAVALAAGIFAAGCTSEATTGPDDASATVPSSAPTTTATNTTADAPTDGPDDGATTEVGAEPFPMPAQNRAEVMAAVDNALAALRNQDPEAAARTWRPGGVSSSEARDLLAVTCADGCSAGAEVAWARPFGGTPDEPVVEVFIRSETGDWAVFARRDPDGPGWTVDSELPPPLSAGEGTTAFEHLAAELTADGGELVVAREQAVEVWADGLASWWPHPYMNRAVQGPVRHWIYTEGALVSAADADRLCDYPSQAPGGGSVVANIPAVVDGRLLLQLQTGDELSEAVMYDCEAEAFVGAEPLMTFGVDGEWRQTVHAMAVPSSVVLVGDAEGNARIERPDGSAVSDDYTSEAVLDATGTQIAYLDHTAGAEGVVDHFHTRRVVVRSVADGELVGEWLLPGEAWGGPLWIGDHLVVSSLPRFGPDGAATVTPQPDDVARLSAIEVTTGEITTIDTPAWIVATSG